MLSSTCFLSNVPVPPPTKPKSAQSENNVEYFIIKIIKIKNSANTLLKVKYELKVIHCKTNADNVHSLA